MGQIKSKEKQSLARKLFKAYDINQDGSITKDEMVKILKVLIQVTNKENNENLVHENVEEIFNGLDMDGNDELDRDEFENIINTNLMNLLAVDKKQIDQIKQISDLLKIDLE